MVDILKKKLNDLIEANAGELQTEEVVKLSQELDRYIVLEQKNIYALEGDR